MSKIGKEDTQFLKIKKDSAEKFWKRRHSIFKN
jgi:hypothetical protein